jgi:hypothetical protein
MSAFSRISLREASPYMDRIQVQVDGHRLNSKPVKDVRESLPHRTVSDHDGVGSFGGGLFLDPVFGLGVQSPPARFGALIDKRPQTVLLPQPDFDRPDGFEQERVQSDRDQGASDQQALILFGNDVEAPGQIGKDERKLSHLSESD